MINKHKELQDWVSTFLDDNYLYFESAEAYPDIRMIVPNVGDYLIKTDILGSKYKTYTFLFIGFERLDKGTSDINTENMHMMDSFNEWLEIQADNKNFPNFGPNCSEYEIQPLQNMADIVSVTEDGLAKYMLGAKINYKED